MKYLVLLLLSFPVFACDSIYTSLVTHHHSWARFNSHLYKNKLNNKGLITNPLIGIGCKDIHYFGGHNSIGEIMLGSTYNHKLNNIFSITMGTYFQDRYRRQDKQITKLGGAVKFEGIDIVPVVGLNTEIMLNNHFGINLLATPSVNLLYFKYKF